MINIEDNDFCQESNCNTNYGDFGFLNDQLKNSQGYIRISSIGVLCVRERDKSYNEQKKMKDNYVGYLQERRSQWRRNSCRIGHRDDKARLIVDPQMKFFSDGNLLDGSVERRWNINGRLTLKEYNDAANERGESTLLKGSSERTESDCHRCRIMSCFWFWLTNSIYFRNWKKYLLIDFIYRDLSFIRLKMCTRLWSLDLRS